MNIGIVGAGNMTQALGRYFIKQGHQLLVSYSSDPNAKRSLAPLFESLDIDAVDAGPLYAARFIEPAMFLLVHLAYRQKMGQVGARLLRLDNPALIQHAS